MANDYNDMMEMAESYLLMSAEKSNIKTDIELDNFLNKSETLFGMPPYEFTIAQYDSVKKRVKSKFWVTIVPGNILAYEHKPWFTEAFNESEKKFWKRYYRLMSLGRRPLTVLGEMDAFTNKIMDSCGDPSSYEPFNRHGLVIGDVQSGKTGTYIGLMCKAADVGYNVFIVLTGMSNNLRNQTQIRIDEGFIGFKSDNQGREKVGVGIIDPNTQAQSFTTILGDFKGDIAINASGTRIPIVLVVKKNSTVLDKVFTNLDIDQNKRGQEKINYSLFMIDDEADNASINTKEDSISTINSKIRKIMNLFTKSTYVGFTATPYANVLIDPEGTDENVGNDLFPAEFISCISTPSNYIGPKDIFDPEGEYYETMLRNNEDMDKVLPIKHKNGTTLNHIPDSLTDALDCYILTCAIRDLEGQGKEPMSMMIHSSRFKSTHESLLRAVEEEYYRIRGDITNHSSLPIERAMQNRTIKHLHDTWEREYSSFENGKYVWSEILRQLDNSLEKVRVFKINSESDDSLDYYNHPDLRAIVIGGNSLSRGLTLEGLQTTYFHRISNQYDTLMQMGRWFGYKDNYAELCRIWTSKTNANWFAYIADATEDLKDEIRTMELLGKTPREFGLYVKQDIRGLYITSRNKMLHAGREARFSSSGVVWDTSRISVIPEVVSNNYQACENFLSSLPVKTGPIESEYGNTLWTDVDRKYILDLIDNFKFETLNDKPFSTLRTIILSKDKLGVWDVAVQSGSSDNNSHYNVKDSMRRGYTTTLSGNTVAYIELAQRRLISPTNTKEGLKLGSETEKDTVKYIIKKFGEDHKKKDGTPKAPNANAFLISNRKPLLLIYYLDLSDYKPDKNENPYVIEHLKRLSDYFKMNRNEVPIGLAFCFPDWGDDGPSIVITNKVWNEIKAMETVDDSEAWEEM